MFLQQEKLQHINSISHEGKIVVFATDASGKIYYTVKQDGFEDSYGNTQVTGWEDWQELEFPQEEKGDRSVIEQEQAELTYTKNGKNFYFLQSVYHTQNQSDVAPVQLISGLGHLYVFRQSKANTLLVDRFVLDGLENKLVRKLEVRYKRSRQKYQPLEQTNGNKLSLVDSLDFRDVDGNPFYEPTTELSIINNLYSGWFSVVLLPTNEHDQHRWHIFAYNSQTQRVELTSIRASKDGLFDVKDYTILEPQPGDETVLLPRSIPGIIKRTLDIKGVNLTDGLAATKYDIQVERQTQDGEQQLLKEATRVMLVIPTEQGDTAALSFPVAGDGTLAQIDETPATEILRSNDRHVLLPLNTLDEIKAIGESMPPAQGAITGMERTEADNVKIISNQSEKLKYGDIVQISGTNHYNGHYVAKTIDANTFEIEAKWLESELGNWEVVPKEESGLVFDGIITAYEKTVDGKLRVTAPNHGLHHGDEVQITDTQAYNDTYPIMEVEGDSFTIGMKWQSGEAVNLKLESKKRRGITFNGDRDYISIPPLDLKKPHADISCGETYSAWVYVSDSQTQEQLIVGQKDELMQLFVHQGKAVLKVHFIDGFKQIEDTELLPEKEWVHLAGVFSYNKKTQRTTLSLCRNGQEVAKSEFQQLVSPLLPAISALEEPRNNGKGSNAQWTPEFWIGGAGDRQAFFAGKISDVQIWNQPRTAQEIKDSMYLQLTGREVGLVGYWRLGAIMEDKQRHVVDFSIYGNDGTVYGEAFVSAVSLERTLRDGKTPAIKYVNNELFAVSQRATYLETFEFRGIKPNNFEFSYWGKPNRNSQQQIAFAGGVTEFKDLGNGWYLASCRFTVPDEITLVRSFEISHVQGDWKQLEIRKHYIRIVSDSITQDNYTDSVTLKTLDAKNAELEQILKKLPPLERQEADLLKERNKLEADLVILRDAKLREQQKQQLVKDISEYEKKISLLNQEVNKYRQQYRAELNNPLNYYCYIASSDSSKVWDIEGGQGRNEADIHLWKKDPRSHTQQWKFEPVNNYYMIVNRKFNAYVADIEGDKDRNKADVHLWAKSQNQSKQQWQIEPFNRHYVLVNRRFNTRVAAVEGDPNRDKADVHLWEKTADRNKQQWRLEKTNVVVNNKIDQARNVLNKKQAELTQAQNELQKLKQELSKFELKENQIEQEIKDLAARLQTVIEQLQAVQAELNRLNNEFLKQVRNIQQSPQSMPELSTDSRGLVTKGALLGFVRPLSRINAIETSEGNVQLSYFDTQGRMRQTNYDATSDSRNAAFEQWIPDSVRACPNFDKSKSVVLIEDSIALNEEWTIEAWFSYPLPETTAWNTLTRGKEKDHHIIVKEGRQLGTFIGSFQDSGYNMEQLSPGWHHIAAVGRGEGEQATTTFYIDGRQVGECQAKTTSDVYAIANYQTGGQQFGKVAEVRIWQIALSAEEIAVNSKTLLSSNEPGLLGYYPMNEAQGTEIRDHSENNRHGKMQSTTWFACTALIGHPGHTVMQFDGKDDYINCGKVDFAGDEYTLEAWFKTTATAIGDIFAATTTDHGILLEVENEGTLRYLHRHPIGVSGGTNLRTKEKYNDGQWHHIAAVKSSTAMLLYVDGYLQQEDDAPSGFSQPFNVDIGRIGSHALARLFNGEIADVRVWNKARSLSEIQTDMHQRLTGKEANLIAYWPLNEINMERSPYTVSDLTGNHNGTVHEALTTEDNTLPIGHSALISAEYSAISIDPDTQRKSAMMRRFFAMPALDGAIVLPDKRVELLELKWIGNAQFEPTLLGYIEGAPPVPSENLTVLDNYNNATSVELTASEDVAYSWNREQKGGLGTSTSLFIGAKTDIHIGLIKTIGALSSRQGFIGELSTAYSFLNSSNVSANSNLSISDKLELRGTTEQIPKFPHLGNRFLPKNVGYALVVSGLADVYITRLTRSKRMVGYQVQPNEDVPPDVNTITFLMNPAYVMNGSLDGLVGSSAADERFYQHVPQMRSQYGSLYPASYYRLQEAYDLERQIEQQDRERQSYFENFNSRLVDETSLNREIGANASEYDNYGQISVNLEENRTEENQENQEDQEETNEEKITRILEILEGDREQQEQKNEEKRQEIESKIKEQEKRVQATESFAGWQRKLEDVQIRAGKRNIVNTYVWDADGGLRSESQQFASTVEHTIGGSFNLQGGLGLETAGNVLVAAAELKARGTFHLTQTLTKTERRSKGFALNVELRTGFRGLESTGITDADDRPILPGEKVNRYRLKSFYLEGGVQHFHDFFNYVVDPEWLISNSEEARALRQTKAGKANKTWRVLHRVTYVERPALMGFGRDIRQLPTATTAPDNTLLLAKIQKLERNNQELEQKIDQILNLLQSQQ